MLSNVNVVVCGQVKSENSSLPVTVRTLKMRVLKLPNKTPSTTGGKATMFPKVPIKIIRFILFRFLSGKKCSFICQQNATKNSIQMVSVP